jgi:hypothetical protein
MKRIDHLKRLTFLISMFPLAFIAVSANTVFAQSAHFIGTATVGGVFSPDGGISVKFKEAGLGNAGTSVDYKIGGSFNADYGCINKGGNHPSATNKTNVVGPLDVTASFLPSKNGSVSQTITFTPPDPNSQLDCPGTQKAVLADIAYSGLTLEDTTNTVFASVSATALSATFFTF